MTMLDPIQQNNDAEFRFKCKICGWTANWEEYIKHVIKSKHIGVVLQVFDNNKIIEL